MRNGETTKEGEEKGGEGGARREEEDKGINLRYIRKLQN